MLLDGIFLPLTTPFYPDGRVYLRKLEHNIARYSLTPVAGMLVNGSNGEGAGLTDTELHQVFEAAIAVAAPDKVMIAGVARESVFATLEMVEYTASVGYDIVAVRGPEFAEDPALLSETLTFFEAVADRSTLPLIVLSEGDRRLSAHALARLGNHPNIVGAVDDRCDEERLREILAATSSVTREVIVTTIFAAATGRMLRPAVAATGSFVSAESLGGGGTALASAPPVAPIRTRTRRVGFQILAGSASQMLSSFGAGATGAAPRLTACAPQACCEVWQAFRDSDLPLAEEKLERIKAASERVEGPQGIAASKHGCDLNGYFGGRPRLPLIALTERQKVALERDLKALRN